MYIHTFATTETTSALGRVLDDFELELQLFTTQHTAEIELPELPREAKGWPALIEIYDHLDAQGAPKICQRDVDTNRPELYLGVEGKELSIVNKAVEGIAVEVIAMSRIAGPIRIGVMRRKDRDAGSGLRDAKKFGHERHHIGHVLDDVTADNLVEFIRREGIGNNSEIVDHIRVGPRVCVDADSAGCLIPAATDVEDSLLGGADCRTFFP